MGTWQTQQAFGELDAHDDLDDINLDQLVSGWQAQRSQQRAPASLQQPPRYPPANTSQKEPSSHQAIRPTENGPGMHIGAAPSSFGTLPASIPNTRQPHPALMAQQAPVTHNAGQTAGSMGISRQQDHSPPDCTGGPVRVGTQPAWGSNNAGSPMPGSAKADDTRQRAGPSAPELDPVLHTFCSHGVPLGACQQAAEHLIELKDAIIKVRILPCRQQSGRHKAPHRVALHLKTLHKMPVLRSAQNRLQKL